MELKKQQAQVLKIGKEYLTDKPPAPKSVKIELSPRCNYRCKYCVLTMRDKQPTQDMDFSLFKRITAEMKHAGVVDIGPFLIGESFMNPKLLIKAIRYLKRDLQIPYVFLTSNASLATPDLVEKCMVAGLDSLKWSCNAASEDQFRDLMGVSTELFVKAIKNIREAKSVRGKGFTTKLYASSIRYNDKQAEDMQPFLKENILPYVDWHYWLPLYTAGGQAIGVEQKLGMQPMAGNPGRWDDPSEPLPCWVLFTAAHITHDGLMTACCLDGTGNWIVGDLKKQSFMDCWHTEEFNKLRKEHLNKNVIGTKCERCALYG